MKTISIRIEGVTPLLLNRFTEEAQQKATKGTSASIVGENGSPKEQATKKLYRAKLNGKEVDVIPQPNLFKCIIEGGRFFKAGKSKVTTQKSSMIPAAVAMDEVAYELEHDEPWEVDTRPVRIPSTGGRILAHRPLFHDWAIEFSLQLDTDIIAETTMREIVDAAGKRIGLGDFRPDCKGPFGKFVVTHWEVEE